MLSRAMQVLHGDSAVLPLIFVVKPGALQTAPLVPLEACSFSVLLASSEAACRNGTTVPLFCGSLRLCMPWCSV
jgi:hypothetical protein